jgi:phosphopantothenoylcysteine decarboxylase/phosphopantothenate--cysteine ligase
MYLNAAVQSNLDILRRRGVHIIDPDSGELACGDEGTGRLPEPDFIIQELEFLLRKKGELSGKKVLVTAGPTREFFDAVRFISSPSSGKMGYAIAEEAASRGADVTLISGPTLLPNPAGIQVIRAVTAEEMNAITIKNLDGMDVAIMAAAVSDYKPVSRFPEKLKKGKEMIACDLKPTPDILEGIGKRENGLFLVGFAAETGDLIEKTREKMLRKNCSLMVGNSVSSSQSGFESDENEIVIISRKNDRADKLPLMAKRRAAAKIMDRITEELGP